MTDRESKVGHDRDIAPNIDELILPEANGYHFLRFEAACDPVCRSTSNGTTRILFTWAMSISHMSRQFVFTAPNIYTTIDLQKAARCNGASVRGLLCDRRQPHRGAYDTVPVRHLRRNPVGPDRRNDDADANPLRRRFPVLLFQLFAP